MAIHAALGLAIIVGAIHNFFWNVRWGTRGTVWATGAALVLVLAAGFSGGAFLTYNKDVYSLLMALFFRRGDAVLRHRHLPAAALARSREDASLGEIEVAERRRAHEGLGQA